VAAAPPPIRSSRPPSQARPTPTVQRRLERAEDALELLRAQETLERRHAELSNALGLEPESPEAQALGEVLGLEPDPFASEKSLGDLLGG